MEWLLLAILLFANPFSTTTNLMLGCLVLSFWSKSWSSLFDHPSSDLQRFIQMGFQFPQQTHTYFSICLDSFQFGSWLPTMCPLSQDLVEANLKSRKEKNHGMNQHANRFVQQFPVSLSFIILFFFSVFLQKYFPFGCLCQPSSFLSLSIFVWVLFSSSLFEFHDSVVCKVYVRVRVGVQSCIWSSCQMLFPWHLLYHDFASKNLKMHQKSWQSRQLNGLSHKAHFK